jgi:MFS family permease
MTRRLATAVDALRRVLANPDMRRALLAWMLGYAAEWSWLVALWVYAYEVGGVAAVGAIGLARTLPAAVLAPSLSTLADRLPRHWILLAVHIGRATIMATAAMSVALGWPTVIVYFLGAIEGLFSVLHRPSHASLLPSLARSPEDLVASNAASGIFEGIGSLAGPALAGLLLATAGPAWTFVAPAVAATLAAIAVAGVRPAQVLRHTAREGIAQILLGGVAALVRHPAAGLITALFFAQIFVRGLLNVLLVVAAVELLGVGEAGVGWLNSSIGVGGLIGALTAMTLVGSRRMAPAFAAGLVLWGSPILLIGLLPQPMVAAVLLAVLGLGNAVLDVAGYTIVQRSVPNAVRGRVFGVLEALVMLGLGVGSILAPILVRWLGPSGALVATGALLPSLALLTWRWVARADAAGVIPARELRFLRGVPLLASLPMTVLEQVAGDLAPLHFAAGEPIITQGQVGDRFYIVTLGETAVVIDGHEVRRMGPGDAFGEIALLRAVPRTATVTAVTDVEGYALDREHFLAAVTGDHLSLRAADAVVEERLAAR